MPQLIVRQCDGGEKGRLCRQVIDRAFHNFFGCGVKKIEDACNNKRASLIEEWKHKGQVAPMREYGLSIPYRRGIEEITPPFELNEPDTVELYVLERERSRVNQDAPFDITLVDEKCTRWAIKAYLDVMDYSNNHLQVTGAMESIEELTYHELLHACGDVQYDGILRHNAIGITCVKELLGKL